jgi:uncharacterized membrane protein
MEETTDLFGIPVPSTNSVFLGFVVVHILISIVAVLRGVMAMLLQKGMGKHSYCGRIYFWSVLTAFLTVVILSIMRWPHNIHLLSVGVLTVTFTFIGHQVAKTNPRNWPRVHTICMGCSYILLLTGFYVDNGKNLPFWRMFPHWFFWVFPALIGIPVILYVLKNHPLNKRA